MALMPLEMEAILQRNLEFSINKLLMEQNYAGGWGWVKNGDPNAYITAYAYARSGLKPGIMV